jgi:hypothetical protein
MCSSLPNSPLPPLTSLNSPLAPPSTPITPASSSSYEELRKMNSEELEKVSNAGILAMNLDQEQLNALDLSKNKIIELFKLKAFTPSSLFSGEPLARSFDELKKMSSEQLKNVRNIDILAMNLNEDELNYLDLSKSQLIELYKLKNMSGIYTAVTL